MAPNTTGFVITSLAFQCILLILYGVCVRYDFGTATVNTQVDEVNRIYPMYQDVHVMIFIGFGFLMTFMAKYSFSAVGYNFLISAFALQWAVLCTAFWEQAFKAHFHTVGMGIKLMIDADFGAGSVMIAFGAMLGKTTPTQMMYVAAIHLVFWALNFSIGHQHLRAIDMGGSIFVHMYGAYFGLGCAWAFGKMNEKAHPESIAARVKSKEIEIGSTKVSDMFAMLGCIFLWMFWPSFNGGLATGSQQHRVMINTVMALAACCVTAFSFSILLRPKKKFCMVDIQNATLAGGVAVGSSADLLIQPWGAILIGMIAGAVSVLGYVYLTPFLEEKIGLHDTCGVHNLHGIPGFMGCVGGAASASLADATVYGKSIGEVFPAMSPSSWASAQALNLTATGEDRSASRQAGIQVAAGLICMLIALGAGVLAGLFIGSPLFEQEERPFEDIQWWEIEEEEEEHHHHGGEAPTELTETAAAKKKSPTAIEENKNNEPVTAAQ